MMPQNDTPRSNAAAVKAVATQCAEPLFAECQKLERELAEEKRVRRNAEQVTADALTKRNQAEADRDQARTALGN